MERNKAFCDLAREVFGNGWTRVISIHCDVSDHRARLLNDEHGTAPTKDEIIALVNAASRKTQDIHASVYKLYKANVE